MFTFPACWWLLLILSMYFVRQGCRQFLPDVAKMLSVGWKIGLPCLQAKSIRRIQSWNILLCFQISMNINVQQYYMFGKFEIFENMVTCYVKARISPWIGCIAAYWCKLLHIIANFCGSENLTKTYLPGRALSSTEEL